MRLSADQTVVLVCEKKSQLMNMHKAFIAEFPDVTFHGITTHSRGPHTFGMKLPRNMPMSGLPAIAEPVWNVTNQPVYLGCDLQEDTDARALLRSADVIICATDTDSSGAHAFRNLTRHYLQDPDDLLHFPRLHLMSEATDEIRAALHEGRTTADAEFTALLAVADAKKFFDSCWSANAIPIFAPLLRQAGAPQGKLWMSKFSLQLLFGLKDAEPMTESEILRMMHRWKGTGKYDADPWYAQFAGAATRAAIIQNLKDIGFLEDELKEAESGRSKPMKLRISASGLEFLELIHPRCRDADLPFRLADWGRNWPGSRPQIETYIKTFFGRQLRYSSGQRTS